GSRSRCNDWLPVLGFHHGQGQQAAPAHRPEIRLPSTASRSSDVHADSPDVPVGSVQIASRFAPIPQSCCWYTPSAIRKRADRPLALDGRSPDTVVRRLWREPSRSLELGDRSPRRTPSLLRLRPVVGTAAAP